MNISDKPYILYGSQVSLYTGKIRSYLRKKQLPFEERLTNHPHFLTVVAAKAGGVFQPTIEAPDGAVVRDTTAIIDFIEARHTESSVYPVGPAQRLMALLFELFGDEGLLKAAMHYRWNYPEDNNEWVLQEFSRFANADSKAEARAQAEQMEAGIRSIILPGLGINTKTASAIEASYEEFLDLFEQHLQTFPYLLGGRPCIGDFGLMAPLYAHLGRDPYSASLMKKRAPAVYAWVERMNAADSGMADFPDMPSEFLTNDIIPETLLPIIKLITQDFMPELHSVIRFLDAWLAQQDKLPANTPVVSGGVVAMGVIGALGEHTVSMRDVEIKQVVRHYSQWMFQRVLDHYLSLNSTDLAAVNSCLESTGILPYLNSDTSWRIKRVNNIEVFA